MLPIFWKILYVLGYVGLIAVNVASSKGWLGATNGEISAKYPTQLTPSGYGGEKCYLCNGPIYLFI